MIDLDSQDIPSVTVESRSVSAQSYPITTIVSNAFKDITSITIGDGITTIGSSAFEDIGLTSVAIGSGITSIGDGAFFKNSLSSVTINTNQSNVTLGESAFPTGTQIQFKDGTVTYGS